MTIRTAARATTAICAAAALTVVAAAPATAATTTHQVTGNTVSVTFSKDALLDGAICVAAVAPSASAPEVAAQLQKVSKLDAGALSEIAAGDTAATFLSTSGPFPVSLISVALGPVTVSATVAPNVYSIVTYCSGQDPQIVPFQMVGNPVEAIQGSLGTLSQGDPVGALSTIVQGGGDFGS